MKQWHAITPDGTHVAFGSVWVSKTSEREYKVVNFTDDGIRLTEAQKRRSNRISDTRHSSLEEFEDNYKPSTEDRFSMRYPLHIRMKAVEQQKQAISEFLEWLGSAGYYIDSKDEEMLWPRPEQLIGDFFGVNHVAFSAEKDRMYEYEIKQGGTNGK